MHDASRPPEIMPDLASRGIDGGMLVLSRKVDERIIIGESIVVTVIELRGDRVRLGIQVHDSVNIRRAEVPPLPTGNTSNGDLVAALKELRMVFMAAINPFELTGLQIDTLEFVDRALAKAEARKQ